jgi:hypothetical protein
MGCPPRTCSKCAIPSSPAPIGESRRSNQLTLKAHALLATDDGLNLVNLEAAPSGRAADVVVCDGSSAKRPEDVEGTILTVSRSPAKRSFEQARPNRRLPMPAARGLRQKLDPKPTAAPTFSACAGLG